MIWNASAPPESLQTIRRFARATWDPPRASIGRLHGAELGHDLLHLDQFVAILFMHFPAGFDAVGLEDLAMGREPFSGGGSGLIPVSPAVTVPAAGPLERSAASTNDQSAGALGSTVQTPLRGRGRLVADLR